MILIMVILSALSFVWLLFVFNYLMVKNFEREDNYEKETILKEVH